MEQHLSHYKIFYEVAKSGNISKAAKELYISQPAISKSISKLEDNLGVTLFSRNSRGVSLTLEGEVLFSHIKTAFEAIVMGESQLEKIKELNIGKLRIGSSTTLCKGILLPYLNDFMQAYPNVTINIASQPSSQSATMLEKGLLDLGLIAATSINKGLAFKPLLNIHDIFVTSNEYLEKLALVEGSNYNILKHACFMLLDSENSTRQYINNYLQANNIKLQNTIEVTTMDLLIEFAKMGLGVACIIKEFVQKELDEKKLIEIKLPMDIPKRSIGFAYIETNPNPSLHNFLKIK